MKALTFGDISIEPGEAKRGRLGSIYLHDGTRVDLPLMAVRGNLDGPVFWMDAAMFLCRVFMGAPGVLGSKNLRMNLGEYIVEPYVYAK